MKRRDFIKKLGIAAAASQLPLDALTLKTAPSSLATPSAPAVLSDALMDKIANALYHLSSSDSILSDQLYRAKKKVALLADLSKKNLTEAAKKELIIGAEDATEFLSNAGEMQDSVATLLPYKEQLPEIIQTGLESHSIHWIGLRPNEYKPRPDPLDVLDKYQQGYYGAMDAEAAEIRQSVVKTARETYGCDVENKEAWRVQRKEILATPEMRLQSLGTELKHKDFRAYTLFNDPLISKEGSTQTVQIVIDKRPGGWPWHSSIRKHLESIKEELDAGVLPAIAGSVMISDTRLLLKIDHSKPEAKEAIAFLQQFAPQKANLLTETAASSETQPMLPHVEKLALRTLRPSDGYSK